MPNIAGKGSAAVQARVLVRTSGSELSSSTLALLRGQLRAALLHEVRQAQRVALAKSRQVAGQVNACAHT